MTIKLYKYHGDNRKIEKSLDLVQTISNATVVETMDIINPVIILEVDQTFASVVSFNYIYIERTWHKWKRNWKTCCKPIKDSFLW